MKQLDFWSFAGLAIVLAGVYGWTSNIYMLFSAPVGSSAGMIVCRVAGIFVPPLGAVLGYI